MYWQVVTLTSDFHIEFAIHEKILSRNTAWISYLPIQYCITELKNKQTNKHKLLNQSKEIMHMIFLFNYLTLFNILFHFENN